MAPDPNCPARRHGTVNDYRRYGCRCPAARELMRARWRAGRLRRRTTAPAEPFVDEIAVERACAGDPVRLTRAERRAAVAALDRYGYTARVIGGRLGITMRAVQRHRLALRQQQAEAA